MDFTEGALDIPREALIACLVKNLGQPEQGNSQFAIQNLYDLIGDRRYYVLRREMAVELVAAVVLPEPWIPDVCDCDSKTVCFGADSIRAAKSFGWKFGLACAGLSYVSKTLGLPHVARLSGYHQAPMVFTHDGNNITPEIVQPPHLTQAGVAQRATWQGVREEMKFWVTAGGIT